MKKDSIGWKSSSK